MSSYCNSSELCLTQMLTKICLCFLYEQRLLFLSSHPEPVALRVCDPLTYIPEPKIALVKSDVVSGGGC
ncbi:hypothetical protein AOLI_G00219640 [Acnodon oligacanthus]